MHLTCALPIPSPLPQLFRGFGGGGGSFRSSSFGGGSGGDFFGGGMPFGGMGGEQRGVWYCCWGNVAVERLLWGRRRQRGAAYEKKRLAAACALPAVLRCCHEASWAFSAAVPHVPPTSAQAWAACPAWVGRLAAAAALAVRLGPGFLGCRVGWHAWQCEMASAGQQALRQSIKLPFTNLCCSGLCLPLAAGMNGHAGGQPRRPKKDAPHEMDLQCSLEELYRGTTRRMKIRCALRCCCVLLLAGLEFVGAFAAGSIDGRLP